MFLTAMFLDCLKLVRLIGVISVYLAMTVLQESTRIIQSQKTTTKNVFSSTFTHSDLLLNIGNKDVFAFSLKAVCGTL